MALEAINLASVPASAPFNDGRRKERNGAVASLHSDLIRISRGHRVVVQVVMCVSDHGLIQGLAVELPLNMFQFVFKVLHHAPQIHVLLIENGVAFSAQMTPAINLNLILY